MSNMSYCRFENTYADLRDCADEMSTPWFKPEELPESEKRYHDKLVELCRFILTLYVVNNEHA